MSIVTQIWNEQEIQFAESDTQIGKYLIPATYVNVTAMCNANGKLWADYNRLKDTEEYFKGLSIDLKMPISSKHVSNKNDIPNGISGNNTRGFSKKSDMGIPISGKNTSGKGFKNDTGIPASSNNTEQQYLIIQVTGSGNVQATYVHPEIAIDLARWVSVPFKIWTNRKIVELIENGYTVMHEKAVKELEARIIANAYRCFSEQTKTPYETGVDNYLLRLEYIFQSIGMPTTHPMFEEITRFIMHEVYDKHGKPRNRMWERVITRGYYPNEDNEPFNREVEMCERLRELKRQFEKHGLTIECEAFLEGMRGIAKDVYYRPFHSKKKYKRMDEDMDYQEDYLEYRRNIRDC